MAKLKADKFKDYVAYAQHCLKTVKNIPDRKSRLLFREMAAEWLNLAAAPVRDAGPAGARVNALPPLLPGRRRYRARLRVSQ